MSNRVVENHGLGMILMSDLILDPFFKVKHLDKLESSYN